MTKKKLIAVSKAVAHDGRVYYSDAHTARELRRLVESKTGRRAVTATVVMTEDEYRAIPATPAAKDIFAP